MDNETDTLINVFRGSTEPEEIELSKFKTEFAKYLQSDNLSFLFGAGCSSFIDEEKKQLGIDTMGGLYEKFKVKNPNFKVGSKNIDDEGLEQNLERVMDILISLNEAQGYIRVKNKADEQINKIRGFIKKEILNNTPDLSEAKDNKLVKLYRDFYMRTVSKTRKNPINIVTTNYDLYNEMALDSLGYFYNDGFSGNYGRKFNPQVYNYVYANSLELDKNIWTRVENFFNLFKIHGSISWVKDSKGEEIFERFPDKDDQSAENVMIYPTPLKDRSTLMVPYSDLFRNFQNHLARPNSVLVVIGYSFGDDHINRIILDNLAVPSFRLIVFGVPETVYGKANKILQLLQAGDKRIMVVNSADKIHYFNNFVEKLMPSPLPEISEKDQLIENMKNIHNLMQEGTKSGK